MQNGKFTDTYQKSRVLYIIEFATEYLIALLLGESFLAKLSAAVGLSDALTGILYSFVALGASFQLLALLRVENMKTKPFVIVFHTVSELFFSLTYLIPVFAWKENLKPYFFVGFLLLGAILDGIVKPRKIRWLMSFVKEENRGRFTAWKEVISLVLGIVFSYTIAKILDKSQNAEQSSRVFFIVGLILFSFTLIHSLSLLFAEKPAQIKAAEHVADQGIFKNKKLLKTVFVFSLWNFVKYSTYPFYGSYKIKELGFSMVFCSILAILYSIVRIVISAPLGKYGDKTSFAKMMFLSVAAEVIACGAMIFCVPSNGKLLCIIYFIFDGIAMAGVTNASINLVFDAVGKENRTPALAFCGGVSGGIGFLTSLLIAALVKRIQNGGNQIFGMAIYAQQFTSALAAAVAIFLCFYLFFGFCRKEKTSFQRIA